VSHDPYVYPGTDVLRNLLDIRDAAELQREHIESYAGEVFGRLADERRLADLDCEMFIDRLAHYLGEVNALHPFREGNGRAQRAFFDQLADDAGYQLNWDKVDPESNVQASIAAMRGDEQPLRDLLADVVTPVDD
jgi:cell filamentation protein, protein adenylyltransferase